MSENGVERAPTSDLAEMPATAEIIHGKLDHLILAVALLDKKIDRAATGAEAAQTAASEARAISLESKAASQKAADATLAALQSLQPLTKRERVTALFGGAAAGGAFAWAALAVLGVGGIATALSSCGH
jgi:hypothetical protein